MTRQVIRTLGYALVVDAGLRWMSVGRLSSLLGVSARPTRTRERTEPDRAILEAVRVADRVLRFWPIRGKCLRRSLVIGALLRRHEPALRFGVMRSPKGLVAHAWVEVGGAAVGERGTGEFHVLC